MTCARVVGASPSPRLARPSQREGVLKRAGSFPPAAGTQVGPDLIIGSVLFGMGWALAGLCPGPALASLSFGGTGGLVFLVAMLAGMVAAPPLRARLARPSL